MQEFDFYINLKKPPLGLYVRKGAGLPDLADTSDWQFEDPIPKARLEVMPEAIYTVEEQGRREERK
ncbi:MULTISPECIES: hypothetical protein [Paraburkholderia]|jgi:hypothetical protein|uniref:hypothetical protein n=1 Tax=Paraburkholderia TaxID=1822464 RepID=UPI0038B73E73